MIKKFILLLIILSFGVNSGLGMYDIGYDGFFITSGLSPERELDTLYYTNETSIVLLVNMGISEYVNVSNYHWISLKVNDIWTYTRYTDFKTDDYKYHYETGWFSIYFIIPSNSSYILVTNDNSDDTYYIDEWFEFPLLPTESIIYQNVTNDNLLKSIIINDNMNYDYIINYNYTIFLDGLYWKDVSKNEILLVPDNSDITIYIKDNINTNFKDVYSSSKSYLIIGIGIIFTYGLLILIIFMIYKRLKDV